MSDTSKLSTCQIVCWGLSGLTGLIVLWSAAGSVGFFAALLLALAFAALLGLASTRLVCTGYRAEDRGIEAQDVERTLRQATGVTGYKAPDPEEDDTTAPTPREAPAAEPAPAAAEPTASAATAETTSAVQTGTTLSGEVEPARRKGEGHYGSEAEKTAAQAAGTRPTALDGPRGGKADDLKKIKGVGPKLEKLINGMGFYHFDQIASWTAAEVAWVDDNLKGFKGRVSRDNWVEQAKILAEGGETEFSHRVDEGDVY